MTLGGRPVPPHPPPTSCLCKAQLRPGSGGGWARPKEHHLRSCRARLLAPGLQQGHVAGSFSSQQKAGCRPPSMAVCSHPLLGPVEAWLQLHCKRMPQPCDLFRLCVSTASFVSQDNTCSVTSGASSRGSSALSQAGRRARPYLASLLISGSFLRFWCMRPPCFPGA